MTKTPAKYRYVVRDSLRALRTKLGIRRQKRTTTTIPLQAASTDTAPQPPALPSTYSRDISTRDYLRLGHPCSA